MAGSVPADARPGDEVPQVARKGLRAATLGLVSAVVIGVASTAPAYSLAATLGFVSQSVAERAPVTMLLAFVPMLFIAYAYKSLNQVDPDCGTSFTWVARALGRHTGWLTGWVIVAADIIVMANLAQIAAVYGFLIVGADGLVDNTAALMLAGGAWILIMTVITWIGIELSARTQVILLCLELLILVAFAVTALVRVYAGQATPMSLHVSWSWFNPASGGFDVTAFSAGLLLAVFIYWGWDSAVTVNEETKDSRLTPGRAAVLSTVILLAVYVLVTVGAQAYAGTGDTELGLANPDRQDDILSGLGTAVLGGWGAKALFLAVLTSAAASTQTTILPTARTTLSMAAYRALPRAFARVHPTHLTPTVSTWAMGIASIAFYAALLVWAPNALGDLIASLGLLIAFYYGLTGFASVVYFRHEWFAGRRSFLEKFLLPLLGGLILLVAFVKAVMTYKDPSYGNTSWHGLGGVFLLGVGSILLGVVVMVIWNVVAPAYFTGATMRETTAVTETGEVKPAGET